MTTVQVNSSAEKISSPAPGSATKAGTSDGASFDKEIQSAVEAITSEPAAEQVSTNETAIQLPEETNLSDLEKVLDTLLSLMKANPESDKDNSKVDINPEVYAVLQQLYQMVTGESQNQTVLSRPAEQQLIVSSQQLLAAYQNIGVKKGNLSPAELANKVADVLSALSSSKGEALPQSFLAKIHEVLNLLNPAGKQAAGQAEEAGQNSGQITSPIESTSKALQVKQEKQGEAPIASIQPNEDKTNKTQEDSEAVKAAHHQSQNPMPVGVEKNPTSWKSGVNTPLIPARFFAKEMEAIVTRQIQVNRGTGAVETTLRLFPENLGQVDVRITALNGQITAHFVTNSSAGKEAVEQQLHQLRNALTQQGLFVEKIEVSQNTTTAAGNSNNDMLDQGKGNSRQQQERKQEESSESAAAFDLASLLEEDEPTAGSSMSKEFNTIA